MDSAPALTIRNAWICRPRNRNIEPLFGDLRVENGKISAVTPRDFREFSFSRPADRPGVLDANGRILTLPQVNFHDHFYSRLAKGLPLSGPMDNFEHILKNLWWKVDRALDEAMIRASAWRGILESIRCGMGCVFDHHASPLQAAGSLGIIAEALTEAGLRGALCFETSDRNGMPAAGKALAENRRLLQNRSGGIRALLGLHAAFTLSDETLARAAEICREFDAGIHIHLCEAAADRELSRKNYGSPPLQRLANQHLLNPKSILSHAVHVTAPELQLIADSGAAIVLNPDSNLNNGVGLPEFGALPDAVPLLTGTDGMHADTARSLKQVFLLLRRQGNSFERSFARIQKIFFDQLQFVRQYFPGYPELQPGAEAAFIIRDYFPPAPLTADNFWGHYVYGILEAPVSSLYQHGGFLMKNFELAVDNLPEKEQFIRRQGERLFAAVGEM